MYFVVKALKEIKQGKRAPKAPTWPRNGDLDHLVKAHGLEFGNGSKANKEKGTLSHTAGCESYKTSPVLRRRDPKVQPEAKQSSTDPLDPHPSTAPECLSNPIILAGIVPSVHAQMFGVPYRNLMI